MMMPPFSEASAIELRRLSWRSAAGERTTALRQVSAVFWPRSFHVISGTADSGKRELFRVLGLHDVPDGGEVLVEGASTRTLTDEARADLRGRRLGFVFSAPFLLPAFTAIENVAMPLFKVAEATTEIARARAEEVLSFVGLAPADSTPAGELPPFEQHCVALARALAHGPAAVLVEELDAMHDSLQVDRFASLLRQAAEHFSICVAATASPSFRTAPGDRVIEMESGAIRYDSAALRQPTS